MTPCRFLICLFIFLTVLTSLLSAANGVAADFKFAWDPPASETQPQGYYLYYNEGASVTENPQNAHKVYIQVAEAGFDPAHPGHTLFGLDDGVYYYFVVTADYSGQESAFSNEVIGIDGAMATQTNGSSGSGCFIKAMSYPNGI